MALLFMDGFDAGDTTLPGRWTDQPHAIGSTNPLHGNYAACFGTSNQGGMETRLQPSDEDDVLIIGANFRASNGLIGDTASTHIFGFRSDVGATLHVSVGVSAAGELVIRNGGVTELARSAPVIIGDVWYHIEARCVLHDSTGEIQVRVDGVEVINETGLDTKNGGTKTVFDTARWERSGLGGSAAHDYDDVFVMNGVGPNNNNFLGPCRVTVLLPNGDASPEEWDLSTGVDTFALIDEATPNGDTDYIESDVPGEKAQVTLTDLTDTTHVVYGIQLTAYTRRTEAGPASFRMGVESDANIANGSDHALSESYIIYRDVIELDPDGDVAWVPAQVNALEAFVEVRT